MGNWFWDDEIGANMMCKQLGYMEGGKVAAVDNLHTKKNNRDLILLKVNASTLK